MLTAAGAVIVLEVGVSIAIGLYGGIGPQNMVYWSIPPVLVASAAFAGWKAKMLGAVGLLPLLIPGAWCAEALAHLFGYCLY